MSLFLSAKSRGLYYPTSCIYDSYRLCMGPFLLPLIPYKRASHSISKPTQHFIKILDSYARVLADITDILKNNIMKIA